MQAREHGQVPLKADSLGRCPDYFVFFVAAGHVILLTTYCNRRYAVAGRIHFRGRVQFCYEPTALGLVGKIRPRRRDCSAGCEGALA